MLYKFSFWRINSLKNKLIECWTCSTHIKWPMPIPFKIPQKNVQQMRPKPKLLPANMLQITIEQDT